MYETEVVEERSNKRPHQSYKIVASDRLRDEHLIKTAIVSEKIDGTCSYIADFQDEPWLWARHDKKPTKAADKKFKKFQTVHRAWQVCHEPNIPEPCFNWNILSDFKETPTNWIPASGVEICDGNPIPDEHGHIPGWVPVDTTSKQHVWHLSSVDLSKGIGLFLMPITDNENMLQLTILELKSLVGSTVELIGTNVNGNPYKLGNKEHPVHLLVRHGSIPFLNQPPLIYDELKSWFENDPEGSVEGIVWHCQNGKLFKLHRHHMGLKWPLEQLRLNRIKVRINIDIDNFQDDTIEQSKFKQLLTHNGVVLDSLQDAMGILYR